MKVLSEIANKTRERVNKAKSILSLSDLIQKSQESRTPHPFKAAFISETKPNIIAEIKFASPSEGDIYPNIYPNIYPGLKNQESALKIADDYLKNGAAALSILTEPDYFKGDLSYLQAVRSAHPSANLLMKDFIVDEYQLYQARCFGADAILILLAMYLSSSSTRGDSTNGEDLAAHLFQVAKQLGLTPLVEVHTEEELECAKRLGADLIGINNRDLKTMKVSQLSSQRLAKLAPQNATLISESGIRDSSDIKSLKALGYRGFLIGTHFMRTQNPGQTLCSLLKDSGWNPP